MSRQDSPRHRHLRLAKAELAQRYAAVGRFYEVKSAAEPGTPFLCRDRLEIFDVDAGASDSDAVFVMMNPGGSRPCEAGRPATLAEARMVPAVPDETQYQLMRLMSAFAWQRVRVLNLSDLRESSSARLPARIERFAHENKHDGHSVFSARRRDELSEALTRRAGAPVVLAWGVSPRLKTMAHRALATLRSLEIPAILGYAHPARREWAYYHPLPRGAAAAFAWCATLDRQIEAHFCRSTP